MKIMTGIRKLLQDPVPSSEELQTELLQSRKQYASERDFFRALGLPRNTVQPAISGKGVKRSTRIAIWENLQRLKERLSTVELLAMLRTELTRFPERSFREWERIIGVPRETLASINRWDPANERPPALRAENFDAIRAWLNKRGESGNADDKWPNLGLIALPWIDPQSFQVGLHGGHAMPAASYLHPHAALLSLLVGMATYIFYKVFQSRRERHARMAAAQAIIPEAAQRTRNPPFPTARAAYVTTTPMSSRAAANEAENTRNGIFGTAA